MTAFILLIAFLDAVFIGEFGTEGLPPSQLLFAFGCALLGAINGYRLLNRLYKAVVFEKRKLPFVVVFVALVCFGIDFSIGMLSLVGGIPFDDLTVMNVGFASSVLFFVRPTSLSSPIVVWKEVLHDIHES